MYIHVLYIYTSIILQEDLDVRYVRTLLSQLLRRALEGAASRGHIPSRKPKTYLDTN